jgi:hypothetical protein
MNQAVELPVVEQAAFNAESAARTAVYAHPTKAVLRELDTYGNFAVARCLHTAYRDTIHARHNVPVYFALMRDGNGYKVLGEFSTSQAAYKGCK